MFSILKEKITIETKILLSALILIITTIGIYQPKILGFNNIASLLLLAGILGLAGLGQTFVIIGGGTYTIGLDISIGSLMFFSVVFGGWLQTILPSLLLIVVLPLFGITIGLINGFLITKVGIPPFIETLGMSWVLMGIAMEWQVQASPAPIIEVMGGYVLNIPIPFLFFLIFGFISFFLVERTTWGKQLLFKSSNKRAAILSGISVDSIITSTYMISSFLAVIAGICYFGFMGFPSMRFSDVYTLRSIAVAIIGGNIFESGQESILGIIFGTLILVFSSALISSFGIGEIGSLIVQGVLIISIVFVYSQLE